MNYRLLYILLFCIQYCFSQQKTNTKIDSLSQLSNKVLVENFYKSPELSAQEIYAESILRKAKKVKDTAHLVVGYYFYTTIYKGKTDNPRLEYLDSLIHISSFKPDSHFPLSAYQEKGYLLHEERDFKGAIDAFVKANEYAIKYNDRELLFLSNFYIARLKDRIGNHEEAIQIHSKNTDFAKMNIEIIGKSSYLHSIFALAFTHKNLKNLDSATYYNKLGLKLSNEFSIKSIAPHFTINEGVVSYFRKEYGIAQVKIEASKIYFKKKNDLPNLSEAYFYLGKIAYDQNNKEEAIEYFKKVDTIFTKLNDLFPELRENYILLSKYYKKEKDIQQQLLYTEKLNEIDSILNSNHMYISDYLKNEFDIPKIVSEKEDLILALKETNQSKTTYIYIGVVAILFIIVFFYRRQQVFKKRFDKLLTATNDVSNNDIVETTKEIPKKIALEVPQELAESILVGLNDFEKKNGFLDSNIKLVALAKLLHTNTNYLSKTINHYKEKNINVYLNDLRADYAIERLKVDLKFRNYTIKAIAKEVGFKSSETFSKTFYKKTGIYPSFFIKQLDKAEKHNLL